ncbi:MAG TPA: hypothetical protein VG056_02075 [Pirellulales bacterium]|jgi:hypothetical protein|nr:hypothetical protein [Pirellulales bacterium]
MFPRALLNSLSLAALWLALTAGRAAAQGMPEHAPGANQTSPADEQIVPLPPVTPEPISSPPLETLPANGPAEAVTPPPETIPNSQPSEFGGRGDMFGAMWGPPAYRLGYKAAWFPDELVTQQATHFGYADQSFSFTAPLWHNDINVWSTNIGVRAEIFSTAAILPDTHQPFPEELWNIHFGTSFRHQFDSGWSEISSISLGSASDKPFAPTDRVTIGFNEMVRVPQGEHNAWLFSLSYSNNSELAFPIPGVAYLYQPSDTFRATLGVPFSLMWRPRENVIVDASYSLIRRVHARVTYLAGPLRIFTGFDWGDETYFLSDRPTSDDRFYYYDKQLTAGVQWPLAKSLMLEISSGYVFQRFYYEGGTSYSDRFTNRLDIGAGPFAAVQLQTKF